MARTKSVGIISSLFGIPEPKRSVRKKKATKKTGRSRKRGTARKKTKTKNYLIMPKGHVVDIKRDERLKAKKPGRRISKSGKVYYEHRYNRADIDRRRRL